MHRFKKRWRELLGALVSIWIGVEVLDGKVSMSKFGGELDFGAYGLFVGVVFIVFGAVIVTFSLSKE